MTNPYFFSKNDFREFIIKANNDLPTDKKIPKKIAWLFYYTHNAFLLIFIGMFLIPISVFLNSGLLLIIEIGIWMSLFSVLSIIQGYNALKYKISATFTPTPEEPNMYIRIGSVKAYALMYLVMGALAAPIALSFLYALFFI